MPIGLVSVMTARQCAEPGDDPDRPNATYTSAALVIGEISAASDQVRLV
jgi:hypothetical protein